MVKESDLAKKQQTVNGGCQVAHALYFYGDPVYCIVYGIMRPYKNFPSRPYTSAQNKFNKIISRLRIEMEHGFAIYQNLWTWNGFYLGLKLGQGAVVYYAVAILLADIWTCIQVAKLV